MDEDLDSGIVLRPDRWAQAIQDAMPALIPLGIIGVWRWTMFLFRVIGWQLYRPQPPTSLDKFKTEDVTLIIPTIDTDEEAMHEAMRSWVLNEPYEILIITVGEHLQKELQHIASTSLAADITRVLYVEKPANKRIQLVHDDDAIWNANFLKWLLVPFNDPKMGGTGSSQIMRPNDLTKPPTMYERIADMRLSGRMLEACASTFYDGSVSCLSGRTALYHKRIITDNFPQEFTGELWLNKYPLISGDDKFMTRWIVKHKWKMHMQVTPECTLATTFKADGKFFMQILRWTRNTWRSDCKSLVIERDIWYRYPVQAVLMVDRMISPFTLTIGPVLFVVALTRSKVESWTEVVTTICIFIMWLFFSRTLRMLPHFYRCPEDISYLIYFIGYQYYFAFLKLYALFTLHVTSWGTREGVAGGVKQENKIEISDQAKDDQRVEMAKKKRKASNLYKKGNISLMRRIHGFRGADDQEMENRARAHLQEAEPTMFNAAGTDPTFQSYMYTSQFGPAQQTFMQPNYQSDMGMAFGSASAFGVPQSSDHGGPPRSAGSVMDGVGSS